MIQQDQRSFRSQISYVDLVGVLTGSALMIVLFNSRAGAVVFAVLGVLWVGLVLRSVIEVGDDGVTVRGLFRTRELKWPEIGEFVAAARVPGFSCVSVVTTNGEAFYVHGTVGTPLDPAFPVEAVAELNRALVLHGTRVVEHVVAEPIAAVATA